MACRIDGDDSIELDNDYKQNCLLSVALIYETVYKNDDMGFEQLQHLYNLHQGAAEYEALKNGEESLIRQHLERAFNCCEESMSVKKHKLNHPMLYGWQVYDAPSDNTINLRFLYDRLSQSVYDRYREKEWFDMITKKLDTLLNGVEKPTQ